MTVTCGKINLIQIFKCTVTKTFSSTFLNITEQDIFTRVMETELYCVKFYLDKFKIVYLKGGKQVHAQ